MNNLTNDHGNTLTKAPRTDSLFHYCSIFKTEYSARLTIIVMMMFLFNDAFPYLGSLKCNQESRKWL